MGQQFTSDQSLGSEYMPLILNAKKNEKPNQEVPLKKINQKLDKLDEIPQECYLNQLKLEKKEKQKKVVMIVITMYNEVADKLIDSIEGIEKNVEDFPPNLNLCVVVVCDGRSYLNPSV